MPVWGEPPRLEQEYKLSLSGTLTDAQRKSLYDHVARELPKREWANAKFVTGSYYMGSDLDVLYFEDTYFDDASASLERSGISHRLRYRWNSLDDVFTYAKTGTVPQRIEIQTKAYGTGAISNAEGYKRALKNRYEIKNDFRLNPITSYLLKRQNGEAFVELLGNPLFGRRMSPVILTEDAAKERGLDGFRYSDLRPSVRLIVKRTRFHVNKTTPFGYGDNPDNVFLVTIDEAAVYSPDDATKIVASFSEIEIDFERNTFFKLFDSVYKAGNDSNREVLSSFEADQKTLKNLISEELAEIGLPPETDGGMMTKYSKALRATETNR